MASNRPSLVELENESEFIHRHIGPSPADIQSMLAKLGMDHLDQIAEQAIPANIRNTDPLEMASAKSEATVAKRLREFADQNKVLRSMIGMGYSGTHTPPVIQRNILENPGWYTAYTPYQAEISQGRLEALLNYQTMIMDLTGLGIANSSLLDEGTAAAEAVSFCMQVQRKNPHTKFYVADDCHPQTIEIMQGRAEAIGVEIVVGCIDQIDFSAGYFGLLVQYPSTTGQIRDFRELFAQAKENSCMTCVAADLLSLAVLTPPAELGADVALGNTQRFGVPMGFGGPHAAYFATSEKHKRSVPGRIIGMSKDSKGRPGLRLALQTREQHIRREKATSNICTAQVLLAVMAGMYACYHGPEGIKRIAQRTHRMTAIMSQGLKKLGFKNKHDHFFDTLCIELPKEDAREIYRRAQEAGYNLRPVNDGCLGISCDETTTREDITQIWSAFAGKTDIGFDVKEIDAAVEECIPSSLERSSAYMQNAAFNSHHSETDMLRYLNSLQEKDLSLTKAMIPLGSCTMKLNSTTEMISVTWPEFAALHPFAPLDQAQGTLKLIHELEAMLAEITGFHRVSLQPNAGSQGEFAGLLVIRKYHLERGDTNRNICLIPSSAHGTNPASAVMAGMKVVVTKCDSDGNIDLVDLAEKAEQHKENLAALMVTYPSTHGVFEEGITKICEIIHDNGGQVYMDGANMNALVGLARPGKFGPDVCHLNLHKTFAIPHGGGGPGVGPIGVAEHLAPYLPSHSVRPECGPDSGIPAVSAAPWGSALVLPISWSYVALLGREGVKKSTEVAILSANYIAKRLEAHYPVLYKAANGWVAHECIIDVRPMNESAGVTVDDFAKRLIDYGFHAPTMSWPVAGTLMIEPTESEPLAEIDRFCDAMIAMRKEVSDIEDGRLDAKDNPMANAPHTIEDIASDEWEHSYSRQQAAFPLPWVKGHKFWPAVGRVDNAYGDRNLVCSCAPIEDYATS